MAAGALVRRGPAARSWATSMTWRVGAFDCAGRESMHQDRSGRVLMSNRVGRPRRPPAAGSAVVPEKPTEIGPPDAGRTGIGYIFRVPGLRFNYRHVFSYTLAHRIGPWTPRLLPIAR